MRFFLLLLFFTVATPSLVFCQDIHSSHLHNVPLILNPANTGLVEGTGRIIGNYRQQWKAVTANYRTAMFSIDADLFNLDSRSSVGLGMQIIQDVAGDLDFKTSSMLFSASMIRNFDQDNIISIGAQWGWVDASFNPDNIIAFDQEINLQNPQTDYFDFSLGLLWVRNFSDHQFIYGGVAIYHINTPAYSFFDLVDDRNLLYRRVVLHGGSSFNLNDRLKFVPKAIYMSQGPYQQLNLGSFISYNPNADQAHSAIRAILPGVWVRALKLEKQFSVDAFVIATRFNYDLFNFTFSYDVNISSLAKSSLGRGGPEVSLVYQIGKIGTKGKVEPIDLPWKKRKRIKCPADW